MILIFFFKQEGTVPICKRLGRRWGGGLLSLPDPTSIVLGHGAVRQQGREARFKGFEDRVGVEGMGQGGWAGRTGLEAASWPSLVRGPPRMV